MRLEARLAAVAALAAVPLFLPARAAEVVRYVPTAARAAGAGGTSWTTSLSLYNPSAQRSVTVRIAFLAEGRDGRDAAEANVELPPLRGRTISDVLGELFGATGRGGLRLRADGEFLAASRTSTPSATGGTYGVAVPRVAPEEALSRSLLLAGSAQGAAAFRTNAGALNPSATAARVSFRLRDASTGAPLGERTLDLPPLSHGQLDDVFSGLSIPSGAVVEVEATASADVCGCPAVDCCRLPSPVVAWATEVDQRSGDATWVVARSDPGATSGGNGPTERFLMPLLTCDRSTAACDDPRSHRVALAGSDDGRSWHLVPAFAPYGGSVPDAARRGDTLYVYTPGRLVRWHLVTGVQDPPVTVTVAGLPDGFVDPSPLVDENGRIALFFLRGTPGSDPAGCPAGTACDKRFGSATEVEGSDGAAFTLDDGDRIRVTVGTGTPNLVASDPDVFSDGSRWVCTVSHGPSLSVWTSPTLRGTYTRIGDLSRGTGGVGAGHFDAATGRYWIFAHAAVQGATVIRRAVHDRLDRALSEGDWETVVAAETLGLPPTTLVQSPGFLVNAP